VRDGGLGDEAHVSRIFPKLDQGCAGGRVFVSGRRVRAGIRAVSWEACLQGAPDAHLSDAVTLRLWFGPQNLFFGRRQDVAAWQRVDLWQRSCFDVGAAHARARMHSRGALPGPI